MPSAAARRTQNCFSCPKLRKVLPLLLRRTLPQHLTRKEKPEPRLITLFVTNFSLSLSCTAIFSGLLFYCERFALNNDIILETKLYLDSFASQVITPNIAGNLNCSLCWDDIIKSLKSDVSLSHISELGYIVLISASIKQMAGHKALHS